MLYFNEQPIGVYRDGVTTPSLTNLSITPSTQSQSFTHQGYDGYDRVNVSAVTSSIDSNIQASNIKNGVSILGVTGTYSGESASLTNLTVTPTTSQQTFNHTGYDGYDQVVVNAVTSSIDSNIQAGNILSGKSILGVAGNVTKLNGTTKTITPTTSNQTVTPSSPYNGFTSVTVNKVTSAIDSNIQASNILSGVSILGVSGSVVIQKYYTGSTEPSSSLGNNGDIYLKE